MTLTICEYILFENRQSPTLVSYLKEFKSGQNIFFQLNYVKLFFIMRIFFFPLLIAFLFSTESQALKTTNSSFNIYPKGSRILLSESANKTFDPFIDYGEFQDNVAEEESLSFFQHGRSLSVLLVGGYEGITFNMRQIFGDSLFFVGLNISFFIDFHIAFQLSGTFPTGHYNSLVSSTWHFFHYGIDLKYYWYKQYLNEEQKFLNPYLIAGPFVFNMKPNVPSNTPGRIPIVGTPTQTGTPSNPVNLGQEERSIVQSEWELGLKTGIGLELNLLDPLFISFEVTHLYTNFPGLENTDLSGNRYPSLPESRGNRDFLYWLQYPDRPEVKGYKFFGDLFHITAQVGINF